jgi:pilus assembly protein CpaE
MTQPLVSIRVAIAEADEGDLARARSILLQDRAIQVVATMSERSQLSVVLDSEPDVILLSTTVEPHEPATLVKQLLELSPQTQVVLVTEPNDAIDLRRTMLAGARAVLQKPLAGDDLRHTVREVWESDVARRQRMDERARQRQAKVTHGQIITLFSPKGGVGCTLVATNLAIALQRATQKRVALVDYSLQFGTIGSLLNVQSIHNLSELVPHYEGIDSTILDNVMVKHGSGVHVLLPPATLEQVEQVTTESLLGILEGLRSHFDYVVVDTWHAIEEATLAVMGMSDTVLLVTTPEVPALHTTRRFLDMIKDHPEVRGKPRLVVNRHPSKGGVDLGELERSLGMPALATLPSDGQVMTLATNEGIPVLEKNLNSVAGRSLTRLAELLAVPSDLPGAGQSGSSPARRFVLGRRRPTT